MLQTQLDSRYWFIFPVSIFFILVISSIAANQPIGFVLDDAYITISNAQLLLQGGGDGFGNQVPTGATSPLHLLMLTLFGYVMDVQLGSFVLLITFAALYGIGLWKVLVYVTESWFVSACGTVLGLVVGLTWSTLLNGLETGIAMAAVIWVLWSSQAGRFRVLAFLVAALPFIRPELAALSLFLLIGIFQRTRYENKNLSELAYIGFPAACAFALATYYFTGHLASSTAEAKTFFFDEPPLDLTHRIGQASRAIIASPIALPLAGLAFLPALRDGWAFLAFFFAFLIVSAERLPVALFHNDFRYLYPLLPLGIAGWGVVFRSFPRLRPVAIAVFGVLAVFPIVGWQAYRESIRFNIEQEKVALWVEVNLPSQARILIHDAGYLPWHVRFVADNSRNFNLVDAVGLKSPEAMQVHEEITFPSHGVARGKAISQIAREAMAQYAIILDRPFWRDIESSLRQAGWVTEKIYSNPAGYQVFKLTPPDMS